MKKSLLFIFTSIMSASVLAGCGSRESAPVLPDFIPVTTQSDHGLVEINRYIGKDFFAALDADKDGVVTIAEYTKLKVPNSDKRFKKVDKNSDGKVTIEEMMANRKNFLPEMYSKDILRQSAKTAFAGIDLDKNGKIERNEYFKPAVSQAQGDAPVAPDPNLNIIFNLSDLNRDGDLNFSEYEDLFYAGMLGKTYHNQPIVDVPAPVQPPSTGTNSPEEG